LNAGNPTLPNLRGASGIIFWQVWKNFNLGVIACIILGLSCSIIAAFFRLIINPNIRPIDHLQWSSTKAKNSVKSALVMGGIITVIISLSSGLIYWLFAQARINFILQGLTIGINWGVGIALIFILLQGLQGLQIEKKSLPNQAIWRSFHYAIILGALVSLFLGVMAYGLHLSILLAVMIGTVFGLLAAGEACFKHLIIRLLLYYSGYIPWNYARFLDWATERIFLQKVGGGYIFIHRLLLEHFARMK
jgi:hypothetical protein